MSRVLGHSYILATVLFTVYSQLVMRWQVGQAGQVPSELGDKAHFIVVLLFNPWVISGIAATFLSGVSWMLVMTRFEISYAYPFVSLNYILVLGASWILFGESISPTKLAGTLLVVIGLAVVAKG